MKIRIVGDDLFHADRRTDRRTDMTKLIGAFRNLANRPKKIKSRIMAQAVCLRGSHSIDMR
jgi:hypothetical protein